MTAQQTKVADAFARWLAVNQPAVFKEMVRAANQAGQLAGVSDWLSAVGTSFGGAVKAVGNFVSSPDGIKTLGTIGGLYLQTQAQKDALKIQIAHAQAGQAPAPIQTVGANTPNPVPVYLDPVTGQQMPLTQSLAHQLMPSGNFAQYLPYVAVGGVLLVMMVMMRSRSL